MNKQHWQRKTAVICLRQCKEHGLRKDKNWLKTHFYECIWVIKIQTIYLSIKVNGTQILGSNAYGFLENIYMYSVNLCESVILESRLILKLVLLGSIALFKTNRSTLQKSQVNIGPVVLKNSFTE